ncbi:M4 family metallopeptidase [Isoptericola sp. NPDC057559]|uniref:M4 family metallopeptidase n=1 Tax=Isoptericola sp. NPDC057559 TaxID=3346168 RepID=UPI0036BE500F
MTTRRARRILAAGLATATTGAVVLAAPAWGDETPAPTTAAPAGVAVAPATTQGLDDAPRAGTPRQAALAYMADHEDLYDVPAADLQVVRTTTDGAQTAVRLQQRHDGVPVFGAQYAVQTERSATARSAAPAQEVTSATGTLYTDLTVATTPTVSEATAQGRLTTLDPTLRRVVGAEVGRGGLVVLPDASGGSLTWHFTVRGALPDGSPVRQEVYVDAHVGGVVLSYNNVDAVDADPVEATGTRMDGSAVTLQANREGDGTFTLVDSSRSMFDATGGQLRTYDAERAPYLDLAGGPVPESVPLVSSATDVFGGASTTSGAVDAHVNAGKVYEFLADELGRDGVDGEGGTMYSVVNVSSNGKDYANAFWDGSKMVYGHMDGVPLSVGLDVVGHEMTHGVTEHSAGLVYLNQSGALNEAISDYFGNAMETADKGIAMDDPTSGYVGEYLCNGEGTLEDCALRDLNDGRTTQDDYEMITLDIDNGGVHYNSTIVGGALWDLRKEIDPRLADQIVYRAAQNYLTPLSGYTAMRDAVTLAAQSLDVSDDVLDAVDAAFDAHGISEGWEQRAGTQDGTVLATQVIPAYELYGGVDQEAAQVSGDTYVISHGDAIAWDQGANRFGLTVGRFSKPHGSSGHEVAEEGAFLLDPSVDSRRVVFTRITADGVGIYGVGDKGQGAIKRVVDEPGADETEPVTANGTLAWLRTTPDGETDVMVRTDDGTTTNLTPEAGTVASTLTMRQGTVAWAGDDGTWVYVHDLASGETQKKRISGFLFGLVSDIQLTSDRVFYSDDQHFLLPSTSLSSAPLADLSQAAKVRTAASLYLAQFSVTDSYLAYSTYDIWGALGSWQGPPKVKVAPTADVVAGSAVWGAVTCSTGAQLAPALGDGQRAVWLDTSAADTDVVTRATFAGTCA